MKSRAAGQAKREPYYPAIFFSSNWQASSCKPSAQRSGLGSNYFDGGIGRNPVENKLDGILNAWNPMLVRNGYLPFAWDEEGHFIRCMDPENLPDEGKCKIVQNDHEVMFGSDEDTTGREELAAEMDLAAENFFAYLEDLLL